MCSRSFIWNKPQERFVSEHGHVWRLTASTSHQWPTHKSGVSHVRIEKAKHMLYRHKSSQKAYHVNLIWLARVDLALGCPVFSLPKFCDSSSRLCSPRSRTLSCWCCDESCTLWSLSLSTFLNWTAGVPSSTAPEEEPLQYWYPILVVTLAKDPVSFSLGAL